MNIYPYVYKLIHRETGQFYIGVRSANKVPALNDLGQKYFSSSKLVAKLGFENFDSLIIAEFFEKPAALQFEKELIRESWNEPLILNRNCSGAIFGMAGERFTDEHKANLSKAMKGVKRPLSEEARAKKAERMREYNKTKVYGDSPETRKKKSLAHTGLIRSDAHRKATSESLKGHRVSPETAKKISDANKGQKAWNKGKSNTWLKGKPRSAETKAKISAGHKLRNSSVGFSC